ncbi:MAG: hypothetical protein U9Q40_06780 [Campylobacterota bacterium]|nr:hypothetical protein [Campylobacterota bacterium]
MELFTINKYETPFTVYSTYHGNNIRDGERRTRLKFFTQRKLRQILTRAGQSLSQYRNRGPVAITFRTDTTNTNTTRTSSLLVALNGTNLIIITALYNVKRQPNDVFRGVPHYYIRDYVFIKPTPKELREDYHLNINCVSSRDESDNLAKSDKQFKQHMKKI